MRYENVYINYPTVLVVAGVAALSLCFDGDIAGVVGVMTGSLLCFRLVAREGGSMDSALFYK